FASIRVPTPWLSTSMPESVPVKATQRVNGEEVELSGSYTPADRRLVLSGRKVPPTGGAPIEVNIDRVLPTLAMIAVTEADLEALNARLAEAPEEARLAAEVD